jgi:hypothetical protein
MALVLVEIGRPLEGADEGILTSSSASAAMPVIR